MDYHLSFRQVLFFSFFVQSLAQDQPIARKNLMAIPVPLSCTPSCKELREMKDTPDVVCSCSSSCLTYGDCCRDAPFRNRGHEAKNLGCLTLSGLGPISVVNSCPTPSSILSEACSKGLGVTIPVTSKDTGTSYTNHYCALCNRDSFNLIEWPVELRCCQQSLEIMEVTVREYVEYDDERDLMWSVSELRNGSRVFCECKFYARNNDLSFAKSLELRECKRQDISSCPGSWSDESTRKLCNSFLDPVYIGEKVYRNRHCATCRYENDQRLRCSTEMPDPALMSPARLFSFCKARKIPNCISFLRARGHPISFSQLFSMKQLECIPPEGRLCCTGERFDRYLKKCRKIPTRIVL